MEWKDSIFAAQALHPWLDSGAPSGGSQRHLGAVCKGGALRGALVLIEVSGHAARGAGRISEFLLPGLCNLDWFGACPVEAHRGMGALCQDGAFTH